MMLGKLTALLVSGSGGWSTIRTHYVVLLGENPFSYSASLYSGVQKGGEELLIMQPGKMLEGSLTLD